MVGSSLPPPTPVHNEHSVKSDLLMYACSPQRVQPLYEHVHVKEKYVSTHRCLCLHFHLSV